MQSFDAGNAVPVAAAAGLVVNARLIVYGAALGPWFRHESRRTRRLLAAFIIDPMLVVVTRRFELDDPGEHARSRYFLGAAACLFGTWLAATAVGMWAGAFIPDSLELQASADLLTVALLAVSVPSLPHRTAAAVALLTTIPAAGLPANTSLVVAVGAGVLAAGVVDRRSS